MVNLRDITEYLLANLGTKRGELSQLHFEIMKREDLISDEPLDLILTNPEEFADKVRETEGKQDE